ncbi:hypothetical protein BT96DRAFT_945770 [Gymnopus androsaceus JB14]|uniref:Uncharacterized protein n=1 Tax=Gymnopus androsaceus JB14 TaxID=1447944 RepID=A0A6A4GZG1_9AGAR|nr:hypothetical protein BT96DRAFT_945770 [Gymnopus androsaceus JB14]
MAEHGESLTSGDLKETRPNGPNGMSGQKRRGLVGKTVLETMTSPVTRTTSQAAGKPTCPDFRRWNAYQRSMSKFAKSVHGGLINRSPTAIGLKNGACQEEDRWVGLENPGKFRQRNSCLRAHLFPYHAHHENAEWKEGSRRNNQRVEKGGQIVRRTSEALPFHRLTSFELPDHRVEPRQDALMAVTPHDVSILLAAGAAGARVDSSICVPRFRESVHVPLLMYHRRKHGQRHTMSLSSGWKIYPRSARDPSRLSATSYWPTTQWLPKLDLPCAGGESFTNDSCPDSVNLDMGRWVVSMGTELAPLLFFRFLPPPPTTTSIIGTPNRGRQRERVPRAELWVERRRRVPAWVDQVMERSSPLLGPLAGGEPSISDIPPPEAWELQHGEQTRPGAKSSSGSLLLGDDSPAYLSCAGAQSSTGALLLGSYLPAQLFSPATLVFQRADTDINHIRILPRGPIVYRRFVTGFLPAGAAFLTGNVGIPTCSTDVNYIRILPRRQVPPVTGYCVTFHRRTFLTGGIGLTVCSSYPPAQFSSPATLAFHHAGQVGYRRLATMSLRTGAVHSCPSWTDGLYQGKIQH